MNTIRDTYANVVNVIGGREEFVIRFGKTPPDSASKATAEIQTTNQITLSPFLAKKLAALLHSSLLDYENRYGRVEKSPQSAQIIELSTDLLPSEFMTRRTDKEAGFLLQAIKNLNIELGFERSIKLFNNVVLPNRFLVGFEKNTVAADGDKDILDTCKEINMPEPFLKAFQTSLPEANVVLFGFEENERTCVYKAYLEFGERYKHLFLKTSDLPEPFIIHIGYKWNPSNNSINTITTYTCHAGISVKNILQRVSDLIHGQKNKEILDIIEKILNTAIKKIEPYEILYLEVGEENNPRKSFDINIYRANLTLEALYPLLSDIHEYYSIDPDIFNNLCNPVKDQIFGHISGGINREGKDFLTIYFGVKGIAKLPGIKQ